MCDKETDTLHHAAQAVEDMNRDIERLSLEVRHSFEESKRIMISHHTATRGELSHLLDRIIRLERTQRSLLQPELKDPSEMRIEELGTEKGSDRTSLGKVQRVDDVGRG